MKELSLRHLCRTTGLRWVWKLWMWNTLWSRSPKTWLFDWHSLLNHNFLSRFISTSFIPTKPLGPSSEFRHPKSSYSLAWVRVESLLHSHSRTCNSGPLAFYPFTCWWPTFSLLAAEFHQGNQRITDPQPLFSSSWHLFLFPSEAAQPSSPISMAVKPETPGDALRILYVLTHFNCHNSPTRAEKVFKALTDEKSVAQSSQSREMAEPEFEPQQSGSKAWALHPQCCGLLWTCQQLHLENCN